MSGRELVGRLLPYVGVEPRPGAELELVEHLREDAERFALGLTEADPPVLLDGALQGLIALLSGTLQDLGVEAAWHAAHVSRKCPRLLDVSVSASRLDVVSHHHNIHSYSPPRSAPFEAMTRLYHS